MGEPSSDSSERSLLRSGLVGISIGACLALVVGVSMLVGRTVHLDDGVPTSTPFATTPPQPTPPSPSPTALPTSAYDSIFEVAEQNLYYGGDPTRTIELLAPLLAQLTRREDLARAYEDLGEAEFLLGQFQRAAGYYEALFAYRATPDVMYRMAVSYDFGGDLDRALERYLRLAAWEGQEAVRFRLGAEERARDIIAVIGTPTPRP